MEKDKVCCPKCKSEEVRSIDNEPLFHPNKAQVEKQEIPRFDNELYMKFRCDACTHDFTKVFNLILTNK